MAKYLTLLMICLGAITCKLFGQELPSIQLDRPDQTECPFITPKNYIQIEKQFIGKKPNTKYSATKEGREAFTAHIEALEKLIKKT